MAITAFISDELSDSCTAILLAFHHIHHCSATGCPCNSPSRTLHSSVMHVSVVWCAALHRVISVLLSKHCTVQHNGDRASTRYLSSISAALWSAGVRKQCVWVHGRDGGEAVLPAHLSIHHRLRAPHDRTHQVGRGAALHQSQRL